MSSLPSSLSSPIVDGGGGNSGKRAVSDVEKYIGRMIDFSSPISSGVEALDVADESVISMAYSLEDSTPISGLMAVSVSDSDGATLIRGRFLSAFFSLLKNSWIDSISFYFFSAKAEIPVGFHFIIAFPCDSCSGN